MNPWLNRKLQISLIERVLIYITYRNLTMGKRSVERAIDHFEAVVRICRSQVKRDTNESLL